MWHHLASPNINEIVKYMAPKMWKKLPLFVTRVCETWFDHEQTDLIFCSSLQCLADLGSRCVRSPAGQRSRSLWSFVDRGGRDPIQNLGKIQIWGLGGSFFVRIMKRVAKMLRKIILFHLGIVTFRFLFGKTRKVSILMIFGFFGRVHDSQNQLL